MNKKANGSVIILIIIMILFGAIELFAHPEVFAPKECKTNHQCTSNKYCGSDFKCHDIPTKEVVNNYNDFTKAGLLIAVAIILAAIILRVKSLDQLKSLFQKDEEDEPKNNQEEEPKYIRVG